jgi:hypothetical protein
VKLDQLRASSADFAYSRVVMIDERNTPLYVFDAPDPGTVFARLLEANVIPGGPSNLVARTGLVREVGRFDECLSIVADWDLFIRLAAAGDAVASDRILVAYRRHSENSSGGSDEDPMTEVRLMADKYADLARRHGKRFDMARVVRWTRSERRRRLVSRAESAEGEGRRASAAALFLLSAARYRRREDLRRVVRVLARRPAEGQVAPSGVSSGSASSGSLERPQWLSEKRAGPARPGSAGERESALEAPR